MAFNVNLKKFLGDLAEDLGVLVSFQSFRSGIATSMTTVGYTDLEITSIFEIY